MIKVSVIIVVRNEEDYIIECIESIEKQFSDTDSWEMIIVDGLSSDNTKEKAIEYLKKQNYNYLILDNTKKTLAPGWNIGIKNSSGTFVCRPDAHAKLHKNYIINGMQLHGKLDVVAIGGVLETKSKGVIGGIIKEALSSKIGVGNSFRTMKTSNYTDTAVYALYKKSVFDEVGYFREDLVRHQDNDMHKRIKNIGGEFYTSVDMIADYYCRNTISKLLKQMFNIGKYLPDIMLGKSFSVRHLIPFLFFIGVIFGSVLSFVLEPIKYLFYFILFVYFSLIIIDIIKRIFISQNIALIFNIIIIPLIHLTYGLGTFVGLIKKIKNK